MRAITQATYGDPSVLTIVTAPDPVPLPTEVLVRVKAIGLNPVDGYIRSGNFALFPEPPFILGWDIAGVVEALVPGVTRFVVGDEVFGMPIFPRQANAYAELVVSPSRQVVRKPKSISFEQAAALPLAGLTAWQSLVDVAGVKAGDRVLIHAAGGGVGHLAVQIAKARGAYVIATASAAKGDFVRSLGADEVIDYAAVDFAKTVRNVDVVLEGVGGDYPMRSLETLRPGGLLVTIVDRRDLKLAADIRARGFRFAGVSVETDLQGLEALAALADSGQLKVHVTAFAFEDVAKAHAALAASPAGKLVLTV